jgi:ribosomal protein L39E
LAAAGINPSAQRNVAGGLEAVAAALEPFQEMSTDQLAELLRVAREYRQTGKIPEWVVNNTAGSAKKKAPKPPKAPKLTTADAVAKLKDIQQRCISMDPAQIAQEVQGLSVMTVNELKEVQRDFLGVIIGKKKEELLAALQKKIDDYRASRDRVDGILAN